MSDYRCKTEILPADAAHIARAVETLRAGGLVAFPTDTVYGVAALPWNEAAVERLYAVKERPIQKAIPLLISDADQVSRIAALPQRYAVLPARFWPGGLTLVLPKTPLVPHAVSAGPTVAVRMPDLPLVRNLIRQAGGVLAVTSANLSGQPGPVTAQEVAAQLGERIELILDGGPCREGVPSTILDCSVQPPVLLRRGAVPEDDLHAVIGEIVVL